MAVGSHDGAMAGETGDSDPSVPLVLCQREFLHLIDFQGSGGLSSTCVSQGRRYSERERSS